jgi:hypothetical protein
MVTSPQPNTRCDNLILKYKDEIITFKYIDKIITSQFVLKPKTHTGSPPPPFSKFRNGQDTVDGGAL